MAEVQCVSCEIRACTGDIQKTPDFCPRRNAKEALEEADPEVQEIILLRNPLRRKATKSGRECANWWSSQNAWGLRDLGSPLVSV